MNNKADGDVNYFRCILPKLDDAPGYAAIKRRLGKADCVVYVLREHFTPAIEKIMTTENGFDSDNNFLMMRVDPDSSDLILTEPIPAVMFSRKEDWIGGRVHIQMIMHSNRELLWQGERWINFQSPAFSPAETD